MDSDFKKKLPQGPYVPNVQKKNQSLNEFQPDEKALQNQSNAPDAVDAKTIADIERQEKIDRLRNESDEPTRGKKLESYEKFDRPQKKHRFLHFLGWVGLTIILTAASAGAVWYFWLGKEAKSTPTAQEKLQTTAPPPPVAAKATTKIHESPVFQLRFDYPEAWSVVETETGDSKITATSPPTKLQTTSSGTKASQTGQIVLTIQTKKPTLPEFKEGNALAILESEKITYAKPTQNQRASTYISFLSYAKALSGSSNSSNSSKGLDGIYVTGDSGYLKDQAIPMVDIVKGDPLITVTFYSCTDAKCTTTIRTPLSVPASTWQDAAFSKPIKAILQSLIVE